MKARVSYKSLLGKATLELEDAYDRIASLRAEKDRIAAMSESYLMQFEMLKRTCNFGPDVLALQKRIMDLEWSLEVQREKNSESAALGIKWREIAHQCLAKLPPKEAA